MNDNYIVELCDDEETFRTLSEEWNQLLNCSIKKSIFLKHEWMFIWWETYGCKRSEARLFILLVRDNERRLVGILPLYRERYTWGSLSLRTLRLIGSTVEAPEYLDVIVQNFEASTIIKYLIEYLQKSTNNLDLLVLSDMEEKAILLQYLENWAKQIGYLYRIRLGNICPYIPLVDSFDLFYSQLRPKLRYNIRSRSRRMNSKYDVKFKITTKQPNLSNYMSILMHLHHIRWKDKTAFSDFDNEISSGFHRRLINALQKYGNVRIYALICNNKPVSAVYSLIFDRRLYYYQTGIDPEFRKAGVGVELLKRVVEDCFNQDYRELDFLRGTESYKFDWANHVRHTFCLEIAFTRKAKVYFGCRMAIRCLKKCVRSLQKQIHFNVFDENKSLTKQRYTRLLKK